MKKCAHKNCTQEFGLLNHKYECGICNKYFCDEHACNADYIEHFQGTSHFKLEKIIKDYGYVCPDCFESHGPKIEGFVDNVFGRVCHIDGCNHKLNKLNTIKTSCISCGKWTCDTHAVEKKKATSDWLQAHTNYPLAEEICVKCFNEKSAQCGDIYHPKALNMKLAAGDIEGERKAVVVHGILSNASNLDWFAKNLLQTDMIDSVWLYDDPSYQGRVNEASRFGFSDIPLGVDLRSIGKSAAKILGRKAYQVVDLPSYIVEGAARKLASDLKLLDWDNVTLIGHSLGGLVVRCAAEAYDKGERVRDIITLGSPFQAWRKVHSPKDWEMMPIENINYLVLLGKDDWVTTHRSFGDLSKNDTGLKNVIKAIFPDLDHTSIHNKASKAYIYKFIKYYLDRKLLQSKENFFVEKVKGSRKGYISGLHGQPSTGSFSFEWSGEWIEFQKI